MLARARAILALPAFPGQNVAAYLKEALSDPQWVVRKSAIKVLAPRGDADARRLAAEALKDPGLPVEDDAFDLVSTLPPADGRGMIIAALLDPGIPTRDRLMRAALAQDLPVQAAVLAAGLAKGDDYFTARLSDVRREHRPAMVEALLREKDPRIHASVLRFARDQNVDVPAAAVRGALKSSDPDVRNLAAEILARGGDAAAAKMLLPLADGDKEAQLRFLRAAAAAPSEDLVGRLKRYLDPNTPVELLVHVYRAFAGSLDADVRKRVEDDLKSTTMSRRAAATRAVGRLLGPRALPKLYELLVDGSPLIRQLAAESIGELAQAESVEVLERSLRDTERDVRFAVIKALSNIHDKAVVGVASFVIYDTDPTIRKTAILAVCNVNHESAMPILRINVEDADPEIRYNVMRAMIYLDPSQAMSYFDRAIAGLKGDDLVGLTETFKELFLPFLKKAATADRAWARSGALRAAKLLPAIEKDFLKEIAATNPYSDARRGAIERLETLSCADAIEVADAVAADKDPEVRIAAIGTIQRCGDNSTLEKVKAALLDLEENVRIAAASALLTYPKTGRPPASTRTKTPDVKAPKGKGK
jgi:HEAT repeat protein